MKEHVGAIPEGVNYKKGSDDANFAAKTMLAGILEDDTSTDILMASTDEAVICGPNLWNVLDKLKIKELESGKPVIFIVPNTSTGEVHQLSGKLFTTDAQKKELWLDVRAFVQAYKQSSMKPSDAPAFVRWANSDEISYYWSIISYDIEEPFLVISMGDMSVLFDFSMVNGDVKVFTVDLYQRQTKA